MSESQRKIIGLIVLVGLCTFVEVAALTAQIADPPNIICAPNEDCEPSGEFILQTAFGSIAPQPFIDQENFMQYKWGIFGVAMLFEIALALMIIKTLRENQF